MSVDDVPVHKRPRVGGEDYTLYKRGAIVLIKLENFMTYDYAEIHPGAGLNLVVGPNGSGKSSVVSAICLGLGGSPKSAARGSDPRDYIKQGKDRAIIEIHLYHGMRQLVTVISREISAARSQTKAWKVNGNPVSKDEAMNSIRMYHIQVDNLCQFLAQERVADFTKIDPKTLLVETEKSIGNGDLYKKHIELIELDIVCSNNAENIITLTKEITHSEAQLARMKINVDRLNKADELREKVRIMQKKRPWIDVKRVEQDLVYLQSSMDTAKEVYEALDEVEDPNRDKLDFINKSLSSLKQQLKVHKCKLEKYRVDIERVTTRIVEVESNVENKAYEFEEEKKKYERIQSDIDRCEREVANIKTEIAATPPIDHLEVELSEIVARRSDEKAHYTRVNQDFNNLAREREKLFNSLKESEKQLADFQNVFKKRINNLRESGRYRRTLEDALRFVSSPESGLQAKVFGPLGAVINIKDPRAAKYFESNFGYDRKCAWVTQNKEDQMLLKSRIRKLFVVAGIQDDRSRDIDAARPNLEQFGGRVHWLPDYIEAPDPVKIALVNYFGMGIPFTFEDLSKEQVSRFLKRSHRDAHLLDQLMTPTDHYRVTISSYGDRVASTSVKSVSAALFFKDSGDKDQAARCQDDISSTKIQVSGIEQNMQALEISKKEHKLKQERLQLSIHEITGTIRKFSGFGRKLKSAEARLGTLKQKLTVPIGDIRHKLDEELVELACERLSLLRELTTLLSKKVNNLRLNDYLSPDIALFSQTRRHLEAEHTANQRALDEARRSYNSAEREYNEKASDLSKLKDSAERSAPWDEFKDKFSEEWAPDTLAELDLRIAEYRARVRSVDAEENAVVEFEKKKTYLDSRIATRDSLEVELRAAKYSLESSKQSWIVTLQTHIKKIDTCFNRLFTEMKCAGEVRLHVGEKLSEYGLEFCAKFRGNSSMQVVSADIHSGGERSVSTMLYLLALQEVTEVPFRVVDEINQAMDHCNERMIFDRIVSQSQRSSGPTPPSQYFVITPKLLPNLNYEQCTNIRIHNVFNGFYMTPQKALPWKECL